MATDQLKKPTSPWLTKPAYFKAHASYRFELNNIAQEINLYLDIDQNDKLCELRCTGPFEYEESLYAWREVFELACSFCQGLNAHEALKIKFHSLLKTQNDPQKQQLLFDPFALLLRRALSRYWGVVEAAHEYQNASFHELLCRCFGVYRSHLVALILENPALTKEELSQQTKAGMGCTSCLNDLEQLIHDTRARFDLVHLKLGAFEKDGRYVRPMGLTPIECVLKLDELLKQWPAYETYPLMITAIKGYQVMLMGEATPEVLKDLMNFWESKLGSRFTATLDI